MKFMEYNETKDREECALDTREVNSTLKEHSSQLNNIANVGATEKLSGKFKSISLEDILLEIYNMITDNDNINTFGYILRKCTEWNVLGDSITAGYSVTEDKTYHQLLKQEYNIPIVNNYGISSSTIANKNNGYCTRYNSMSSTSDIITVFGGANDFLHDVPLGIKGSTDNTNFYGGLSELILGLKTTFPSANIIFFTPLNIRYGAFTCSSEGTNNIGNTLSDYVNVIKELCNENDIKVIDLYSVSNLNPNNDNINSTYYADGLHPNAEGHILLKNTLISSEPAIPNIIDTTVLCTNIILDKSELICTLSDNPSLIATVEPSNCTEPIIWSVSPANIVVKDGVLSQLRIGNFTVTATCGSYSASCSVTIKNLLLNFNALDYTDNKIVDRVQNYELVFGNTPVLNDNLLYFDSPTNYNVDVSALNLTSAFTLEAVFKFINQDEQQAYNIITLGNTLEDNSWGTGIPVYKNYNFTTQYPGEALLFCTSKVEGYSLVDLGTEIKVKITRDSNSNVKVYVNDNMLNSFTYSEKINYIYADTTQGIYGYLKYIKLYA